MSYTLWSRGRLLGETELGFTRCIHRHRAGDFHPTEFGQTILPIATGVKVAMKELADRRREARTPRTETAEADVASASDRRDALALELRRPDGSVVPTEWIDIRDTEFLWGVEESDDDAGFLDGDDDEEDDPAILHDLEIIEEMRAERGFVDELPWDFEFPRYQIQLRLLDDLAIP